MYATDGGKLYVDTGKHDDNAAEITRIGKYHVLEVLGRGGMGVVYRAIDRQLGREVAIKTLTQGVSEDKEMLARFYEEGRKTARLKHPHIVTVYDLGEENGMPYIVMERVEGEPLDSIIRRESPMSMMDRLRIMEEVCSALGYAHANNVIHRDVKPANIFVQPDGKAKLLDFGIARLERRSQELSLTRAGHIIGTIPYMAPERLKDKVIDGRSDIFSVGVVLHQLITGQLPFNGEDYVLMQKILNEPHPRLSSLCKNCPAGLEAIVDRALAKAVEERYQAAEEMAADLSGVIEELSEEQVVELLPEARRLVEAQDYTRARVVLQQVLKVQNKHTEARELLGEIQRRIMQKQRGERREQLVIQAEEALRKRDFEQSLAFLKEALDLDPSNPELLELRARVQQEKRRHVQVEELLRQAESARRKGDFRAAIVSAREALEADKTNSRIVALCSLLEAEAEQAQKKLQAKALLDTARRQLEAGQFENALDRLRKAEALTPTDPELQMLIGDAAAGAEQARRQRTIADLEERLEVASTLEQLRICAAAVEKAQAEMPAESALFRLSSTVDRRIREVENRRLVEETFQTCRDLRPREALEVVRRARQKLPGDERLQSLEKMLQEREQQQSVEQRRGEYLARARVALNETKFKDAVHILEACEAERLATPEVLSLLEMARTEAAEKERQETQRSNLDRAQALMDCGAYDEAIEFLDGALARTDDAVLRMLRERAVSARAAAGEKETGALASAARLAQAGKLEDALQMLRVLPADVLRSERVQTALATLEDERRVSLFRMAGRAYALVDHDVAAANRLMQRIMAASSEASTTGSLGKAFQVRAQTHADRGLAEAARKADGLLRAHDKAGAEEVLRHTMDLAELASARGKAEWESQLTRLGKKGLGTVRQ
jgi:serine/threonine-protein kinase